MDASYVMPFVKALENVFSTMLQIQVQVEPPRLRDTTEPGHDVSGIIGMSGDVTGAVVLSFPTETALRVVNLFTGLETELGDEDFADAIGELVNMVTGNAKAEFKNADVSISCPSVVIGAGHQIFQRKDQPIIEIPCDCDCGPMTVLVTMRDNVEQINVADTESNAA